MKRIGRLLTCVSMLAVAPPGLSGDTVPLAEHPRVREAAEVFSRWAEARREYHGIPGLAVGVASGGEVLFVRGFGFADPESGRPVEPTTPFRIGSVSKLFTATAILLLIEEGKLELDTPVEPLLGGVLPKGDFPAAAPIRLEHLLTHTSGLPREGPFPYWTTHLFPAREELLARLPQERLRTPPGSTYRYSNLGMALLGEIVARVSRESWARFVETRILRPLGMHRTVADPGPVPPAGLARAHQRRRPDGSRGTMSYYELGALAPAGSVVSTVEDLLKFASLHLEATFEGGASATLPALSRRTLAEMQRPRFVLPDWQSARGLGFLVSRREGRTYVSHGGWIGGHRADFLLDPDRKLAAVALTNADDASPWPFSRKALELLGRAVAHATSRPEPERPEAPDLWSRLVGRYTDPWEWETEVLILDSQLVLYDHAYPTEEDPEGNLVRLLPTPQPLEFRTPQGDPVRFELGPDGEVARLYRGSEYLTRLARP